MEGVLNNVRSTAELLAVAGTDIVQQWDKHTLHRAFQWTLYCQHLHSRFHNKKTIRNTMEKHLRATHDRLKATFPGYTAGIGRFEDLSRCQHLLLSKLLKNPVLPRAIVEILVADPNPVDTNEEEHQVDAATGHCTQLIACKSACKVLLRALRQMRPVACPGADAEVQGVMLMGRLDAVLGGGGGDGDGGGGGGDAQVAHELLKSMLQTCVEDHNAIFVIASALTRKSSTTAEIASRGFLLNWLQQNPQIVQQMCLHVPVDYLMSQVKEDLAFRTMYCNVLKRWASDMTFDIHEGTWVPTGTRTAGVTFKKLTRHFQALFDTCPLLRQDVETELKACKVLDGDFDVEGLSVWGDLLAVLR